MVLSLLASMDAGAQQTQLRVNIVGYPASGEKKALLLSISPIKEKFYLASETSGERLTLPMTRSAKKTWQPFTHCHVIDFTRHRQEGEYRITNASGSIRSSTFRIGRYAPLQEDVVYFMQTQRCGYNPFIDKVCHPLDGRSFYGDMPDSSYVDALA